MQLAYPYQNFYEMLDAAVGAAPNKIAIFIDDRKVSYKALLHKVDAFARFLEIAGVGAGDRVALIAPNSEEFVVTVYAATKIGAVVVPINNMLKSNEFEYILNDSQAKLLVTSQEFIDEVKGLKESTAVEKVVWIDEAPSVDSHNIVFDEILETHRHGEESRGVSKLDDLAIIFYTSGTTGNPKGAMMSYRNLFSNIIGGTERFNITTKDRFIVYLPMFHAFTFTVMLMLPFFARSSFVIIPKLLQADASETGDDLHGGTGHLQRAYARQTALVFYVVQQHPRLYIGCVRTERGHAQQVQQAFQTGDDARRVRPERVFPRRFGQPAGEAETDVHRSAASGLRGEDRR